MLLFGPPESVVDVVGDFGEAAQRGDVRVLFELLRETNGWIVLRGPESAEESVTDSACKTDCTPMNRSSSYVNEAKAVVVQEVLEGLGQSFVWTADQQAAFIVWRSVDDGSKTNVSVHQLLRLLLQTLMRTNKTGGSKDVGNLWRRRPIRAANSEHIRTSTETV